MPPKQCRMPSRHLGSNLLPCLPQAHNNARSFGQDSGIGIWKDCCSFLHPVPAVCFVPRGTGRGEASLNRGLSPPQSATEGHHASPQMSKLRGHVAFAIGLAELCSVLWRHLRANLRTCACPRLSEDGLLHVEHSRPPGEHQGEKDLLSCCLCGTWKVATRKVLVSSISLFSVVLLFMVAELRYASLTPVLDLWHVCARRKVMKKLWKLVARRPKSRHAAAVALLSWKDLVPVPGVRRRELGFVAAWGLCGLQLCPGRVSLGS